MDAAHTPTSAREPRTDVTPPSRVGVALAALIAVQLITGGTYMVAKVALRTFDPFSLGFLRFVVAGAVFVILMRRNGLWARPRPGDGWAFLALAALGVPLNQGLFLYGMKFAPAAHGALLYATTPMLVMVLSAWAGYERVTAPKLVGIGLGFAGVVVVLAERGLALATDALLGDAFVFAAVITWALYTLLSKRLLQDYPALFVTGWSLGVGALLYLPIGLPYVVGLDWQAQNAVSIAALLYLALLTSVVSYLVWSWALALLDPSRVAVVSNLQPVVAAGLGWLVLGEAVTWHFWLGAALVAGGVVLAQRRSDPNKSPGGVVPPGDM